MDEDNDTSLSELLKGQIYVPSGSLVRHNMTSSEFRVLATVSLVTWLLVCCNSSFFGALDRSYQVVAVNSRWHTVVVNFTTRDLILTASEPASAEPTSSYEVWIAKLEFALLPEHASPMMLLKSLASYRDEGSDHKWCCWYSRFVMGLHEWHV